MKADAMRESLADICDDLTFVDVSCLDVASIRQRTCLLLDNRLSDCSSPKIFSLSSSKPTLSVGETERESKLEDMSVAMFVIESRSSMA